MAAAQKPLPSVPPRPHINSLQSRPDTVLTVPAQEHLANFIRRALEEEFTEIAREGWEDALMAALGEVGEAVTRNGWLAGVKRTRRTRKKRRDDAVSNARREEREREELAAKERDAESRFRTRSKGAASTMELTGVKEKDSDPEEAAARSRMQCELAIQQLRELATQSVSPSPKPLAKHLLLTLVPLHSNAHARTPSDYEVIPQGPICTFAPGVYSLPKPGSELDPDTISRLVLFGFKEWDVSHPEDALQLVGGTFTLKGTLSAAHHDTLSKILRVAIYLHLSLLLEQHFLSDSHIELEFPKPAHPVIPSVPMAVTVSAESAQRPASFNDHKRKNRDSPTSTLWNFFSKKTERLLQRTTTLSPTSSPRSSLDLPRSPTSPMVPPVSAARVSEDRPRRERRFSLFGPTRAPPQVAALPPPNADDEPPFQTALRRIEGSKTLLSSSPGIVYVPPVLLVRLAEKEKERPTRKLTGEERTGLSSILGWDGKDSRGRGMAGIPGFVRQQRLSVLYSEHVPAPQPKTSEPAEPSAMERTRFLRCGPRARWNTALYYGSGSDSLGEVVVDLCGKADEPCERFGCQASQGQHERRWIHDGVRIVASVSSTEAKGSNVEPLNEEHIMMWQSCRECGGTTARCRMTDGTFLFSFAKFLEFLIYSPVICTIIPSLCTHTKVSPKPWTSSPSSSSILSAYAKIPLPSSRFNILRHFSFKSHTVSFTISPIEDIFELRVPRLQITRATNGADKLTEKDRVGDLTVFQRASVEGDVEKKELRKEINGWWQGVAEHLDKLELQLSDQDPKSFHKSLPRLPSADEAYDSLSVDDSSITPLATPRAGVSSLPSTMPPSSAIEDKGSFISADTVKFSSASDSHSLSGESSHSNASSTDSITLLASMRHTFQRTEQSLYAQLSQTPNATLNNVRRSFHSAAVGANKRLSAWETKHLPKAARAVFSKEREAMKEPRWWESKSHAVPNGNVIVKEDDWGSIIAFTLSSTDYQHELAKLSLPRGVASPAAPSSPAPGSPSSPPASTAATSSFKFFSSPSKPNPDKEDTVWHEPESCSAIITRKEHPRDPSSLLSIRDVLRNKAPLDVTAGLPSSMFTAFGSLSNRNIGNPPPSAWAKPAVELDTHAADGHVSAVGENSETAGKILQDMESGSVVAKGSISDLEGSAFVEANIRRGKTSSIISTESNSTVGPETSTSASSIEFPSVPPPLPPKSLDVVDESPEGSSKPSLGMSSTGNSDTQITSPSSTSNPNVHTTAPSANDAANVSLSWTNTLTQAMRSMLKPTDVPRTPSPVSNFKRHHGLLSTDPLLIDERPHIKYDWTIGKRLKFSCTVYYAKQFDALRRRCGIDDIFVKSMAWSENWMADGGKSKSNFFKTGDDRFIIKTLVNAWNVADLQVLIELGPSYFRYMETTSNRASILAKLLGFYTVEVRNLETGTVQAKADLLVMENLFYNQKIGKTFDLKGIQGRKVKANTNASTSKTLFDGEWMEGQERALTLVHPHSKVILQEGIKHDCDFLTKSNIMDYSLLLGINEEKKEIVCGLVDTIGSYTFAKTLEYKAKQGLAGTGKDVTVIPPNEYEERFVSSMDSYFVACPDKWSKPPDDKKLPHDPMQLSSVL